MPKWLRKRERKESVHYERIFDWRGSTGSGFGFDCDETGKVDIDKLSGRALDNYLLCMSKDYDVVDRGVITFHTSWWEHAVIECESCKAEVELYDAMTNRCIECGAFYNGSGQRLSDPSLWGEETGEVFSENGQYLGGGYDGW